MTEFLPGFRKALPESVRQVYVAGDSDLAVAQQGSDLSKKQACAHALGPLITGIEIGEPLSSWQELVSRTQASVDELLTERDFREYARVSRADVWEARASTKKVAREGIATTGAYLEVTPKVLMPYDLQDPSQEIFEYAQRSQGFILEWSALHDAVDGALAYALASPTPRKIEAVFHDLHFNSKWFTTANRRITLDPRRVANLRSLVNYQEADNNRHHHPSVEDDGQRTLYGCPARRWLPRIYGAMAVAARDGGLFERTYLEERRNHGYVDAPPSLVST